MRTRLAGQSGVQTDPASFERAERLVATAVGWLRLGIEVVGAGVVAFGFVVGLAAFARASLPRTHADAYPGVRLILARYLAVALEFQLAADILSTAVAPTWERIGKLASVAVIRTGLDYFLAKEMAAEEAHLQRRASDDMPEELRATP